MHNCLSGLQQAEYILVVAKSRIFRRDRILKHSAPLSSASSQTASANTSAQLRYNLDLADAAGNCSRSVQKEVIFLSSGMLQITSRSASAHEAQARQNHLKLCTKFGSSVY